MAFLSEHDMEEQLFLIKTDTSFSFVDKLACFVGDEVSNPIFEVAYVSLKRLLCFKLLIDNIQYEIKYELMQKRILLHFFFSMSNRSISNNPGLRVFLLRKGI